MEDKINNLQKQFKLIVTDLHKRIFALEQEIRPIKRLFSQEDLSRAFIHGKNDLSEQEFNKWKRTLKK